MSAHRSAIVLSSALMLGASAAAVAQGIVVKSTGDVTQPILGLVTTPVIKVVAALKSNKDTTIPIVFTRNVNGVVDDTAKAGAVGAADVVDPVPPASYLAKGIILNNAPGVITTATLNTTPASASTPLGVSSANSSASISALLTVNGMGQVLSAGATTKTSVNAGVTGIAIFKPAADAFATAAAGTDPFVFAPLTSASLLDLQVDLNPNYDTNPSSRFGFEAFSSDPQAGTASYDLDYSVTSNIPGLSNLFDLNVSANSSSSTPNVSFTSDSQSIMGAPPITAGDFTTDGLGDYFLDPTKSQFDVEVAVPAGDLGSDALGPEGLVLSVNQAVTASAATVPEPGSLALIALGALPLAGLAARRRA